MKPYTIKAHPTVYAGVNFRSRLEARWACFFDLANIKWEYEPVDLVGWSPDFLIKLPYYQGTNHSEMVTLLVEVKPYYHDGDFSGHPCLDHFYTGAGLADSSACFGAHPEIAFWECMSPSGSSGGEYRLVDFVEGCNELWVEAGNTTQWLPKPKGQ